MTMNPDLDKTNQVKVKVVLEWLSGPFRMDEKKRLISKSDGITIGRSLNVDWPIPEDGLLSRMHLRLVPFSEGCHLIDLGSTNGTNINDEPVLSNSKTQLFDKDIIQAGRSLFQVHYEPQTAEMLTAVEAKTNQSRLEQPPSLSSKPTVDQASKSVKSPPSENISSSENGLNLQCQMCRQSYPIDQKDALSQVTNPGVMINHLVWICKTCRQEHLTIDSFSETDLAPDYETIRIIGRGSMGVVYLARHRKTDCRLALKIIDPETATNRTSMERFLREMAVVGTLKQPNIVECLDQGYDNGRLWFAMEYVSGINLDALTAANRGTYPVNQACRIICQVLKGLEYAHHQGVVHRDIKPENILIGKTPENRLIAKVSDFGLAKNYQSMGGSGLTFSGEMRGTIPFMPPEQMTDFKTVKPSADLYATAATLYYLIAGTYIFDAEEGSEDMIQMLLDHKIVPLQARRPDIPSALASLIHSSLSKNPEDRMPTATAMRNALKAFT